jgi:hypothetical protein
MTRLFAAATAARGARCRLRIMPRDEGENINIKRTHAHLLRALPFTPQLRRIASATAIIWRMVPLLAHLRVTDVAAWRVYGSPERRQRGAAAHPAALARSAGVRGENGGYSPGRRQALLPACYFYPCLFCHHDVSRWRRGSHGAPRILSSIIFCHCLLALRRLVVHFSTCLLCWRVGSS